METDDEFAARMRALRGEPPPKRVPPWRQLLGLSLQNVDEIISRPGVVDSEGRIAETIGVDLLEQKHASTVLHGMHMGTASDVTVAVQTLIVTPDGDYEFGVVERRVRRVKLVNDNTAWLLKDGSVPDGEWCIVEFRTSAYEAHVARLADFADAERAFESWLDVFGGTEPLLIQHTHASMITYDRNTVGWVVDPVRSGIDEDGERAQIVLKKLESWVNHDGVLCTPWGMINCASQAPVIVEGSELARAIGNGWGKHSIAPDVWRSGLKMPPYDRDRVQRILAAQSVIVEVPLVA